MLSWKQWSERRGGWTRFLSINPPSSFPTRWFWLLCFNSFRLIWIPFLSLNENTEKEDLLCSESPLVASTHSNLANNNFILICLPSTGNSFSVSFFLFHASFSRYSVDQVEKWRKLLSCSVETCEGKAFTDIKLGLKAFKTPWSNYTLNLRTSSDMAVEIKFQAATSPLQLNYKSLHRN